jgi:hypothetical protein
VTCWDDAPAAAVVVPLKMRPVRAMLNLDGLSSNVVSGENLANETGGAEARRRWRNAAASEMEVKAGSDTEGETTSALF